FLGSRMLLARRQAQLATIAPEETLASALPLPEARNYSEKVDRHFDNLVTGTGASITPEQMIGIILLCGVGSCAGFYLWRGELGLALLGLILGLAVPLGYLMIMAGQRRRQLQQQLPDALYLLSRSLRAGMGLEQGFHLVARESPEPLGEELQRVSEQVKLGLTVPAALQAAAQRVGVLDFNVFASLMALHRTTGGALPVMMDRLAASIRDRVQYLGQFRAATAMGRITAIALGAAVPLIFLWYVLFQPETVQIFVETPGGLAMLATAFGLEILGILWLYRLLRTDV
ncbi:MAG TPA: type II secretion system F family protein, partial [Gemmatales bacterium]|nr:type II secretion system F family protein [Gemmatales bacterium]